MQKIRISKQFKFEMGHALHNYNGKCAQIHGHSYQLIITIIGYPEDKENSNLGMVMDFGKLKSIVKKNIVHFFDHKLLLYKNDPRVSSINEKSLVAVPYQPTCELILSDIINRLIALLPNHVQLFSATLKETEKNSASWFASDNS